MIQSLGTQVGDAIKAAIAETSDTQAEVLTSEVIRHIAGLGMHTPEKLSQAQIQKLAASVMRHIEPRKGE